MAKKVTKASKQNDLTYLLIYNRYKNIALNMFEWTGVPPLIPPLYIEETLYNYGKALFFNDKEMGLMVLQCAEGQGLNTYNEPLNFRAIGYNYNKLYSAAECVRIKNNPLMIPTADFISFYASKLADVERTIDVNLDLIKVPYLVKCTKDNQLTLKNIIDQVSNHELAVYIDNNFDVNALDVFDLNVPYNCDKLVDLKHDYTNELATFLGINNANTDKRERLITDEVNANNDFVDYNVDHMLQFRQLACKQINDMFGTSMSCELKLKKEEVEDSGKVHPRTETTD